MSYSLSQRESSFCSIEMSCKQSWALKETKIRIEEWTYLQWCLHLAHFQLCKCPKYSSIKVCRRGGEGAEGILCEHQCHDLNPADGLGLLRLISGRPYRMHWKKEEGHRNGRIVLQRCCFSWTWTFAQRAGVPCYRGVEGGKVLALLDHHHLHLHLHLLHHHLHGLQYRVHTCWCQPLWIAQINNLCFQYSSLLSSVFRCVLPCTLFCVTLCYCALVWLI